VSPLPFIRLEADLGRRMLHNVALNGTLGVISGLGNIAPAALVNVFKLYKSGKFDEAKEAQEAVSIAGELEIKGGVPGMRVRSSCEDEEGHG
jgi:dihydrodipicolinate synthase/N-acetylneuraminate lyase